MNSVNILVAKGKSLESKSAAKLIQKASEFEARIWLQKQSRRANAKSLLGLLSLSVNEGSAVTLLAEGPDEKQALEEISAYLSKV